VRVTNLLKSFLIGLGILVRGLFGKEPMKVQIEIDDKWIAAQAVKEEKSVKEIKDDIRSFFKEHADDPDLLIDAGVFNY